MQAFRKILVATDFSSYAERATLVAADLARTYGSAMTLVHVYDPVSYPLPDGYMLYTPGQLAQVWQELEQRLQRAVEFARQAGAPSVDARLLEGLTAHEITSFASEQGHDLIVIGTHGRSGLQRFLLGSAASRVVQTAACAVLTVRPPPAPSP